MTKRSVPQIMPQRDSFYEILIQPERLGDSPRILRHLQRMCQTGPVMVSFRKKKDLCLLFQTPKCLAVQDPGPVSLKDRADITLWFNVA